MILSASLVRAIQRGEKTTIRRPVQGGEPRYRKRTRAGRGASMQLISPFNPVAGDRLPVRSTDGDASCHIILTDVRHTTLGAIDDTTAHAEGFKTADRFKTAWIKVYDRDWINRQPTAPEPEALIARFDTQHASKTIWLLTFEYDAAQAPRLLAARPARAGSTQGDYATNTAQALPHEPEAVDEATQTWITERAGRDQDHWLAVEAARREQMDLAERLRAAQDTAALHGIDIHRQEQSILQRIRSLEAKVRKLAA